MSVKCKYASVDEGLYKSTVTIQNVATGINFTCDLRVY